MLKPSPKGEVRITRMSSICLVNVAQKTGRFVAGPAGSSSGGGTAARDYSILILAEMK